MAFIVYTTNKKTGVKYAYSAESYRDPVTKKPKAKRTYLGRVDPDTNKIIPKAPEGKRNRSKLGQNALPDVMPVDVSELIAKQRDEIERLTKENKDLKEQMKRVKSKLSEMNSDMQKRCEKIIAELK